MIRSDLRTKNLLSVGIIITIVLTASTLLHIRTIRNSLLDAIQLRSEALAQGILKDMATRQLYNPNIEGLLAGLSLQCIELYQLNKTKHVTHLSVIDTSGTIVAHNDNSQWNTAANPILVEHLSPPQLQTLLVDDVYHTLIPMYTDEKQPLAIIDIGISKETIDEEIHAVVMNSLKLFAIFLVLAMIGATIFTQLTITRPVGRLIDVAQQIARGKLIQPTLKATHGEIAALSSAFFRIAGYFRHIATVATAIAHGNLEQDVRIRSADDVLGHAFQEMQLSLRRVTELATQIAEGDLTTTVLPRSENDTFCQAIQKMMTGLHTLIVQIRRTSKQLATTGMDISELAEQDITIVQQVNTAAEQVIDTMQDIETSVKNVTKDMSIFSQSFGDTSSSVAQITESADYIAAKTNDLNQQTLQAMDALRGVVEAMQQLTANTATSKQLSTDTIQDALDGQHAVEQIVGSMDLLNRTIADTVEAITHLAQRSDDISTILEVIEDIADRTTLLALNAAIIAAQAGTHGRGFAVVAEEIRSLADGVTTSTKDIATIVQSLQQDTNTLVQRIHEGANNVELSIQRTQEAREVLHKILESARRSSSVVAELAESLQVQTDSSQAVMAIMKHVTHMTDDITTITDDQMARTSHINEDIRHLNSMTSSIRQASAEQVSDIHQVLAANQQVKDLMNQNLDSSQHISDTTQALISQAAALMRLVERFKLQAAPKTPPEE